MSEKEQPAGEGRGADAEDSIQHRSGLARWLSAVFSGALDPFGEPAPALTGPTRLARCADFLRKAALEGAPAAGGAEGGARPEPRTDRARFESERVRLLVNSPGGVAAPPYGSWWREGRLQGRTTFEVAEFYRSEGLEPQPGAGPADFLGAELEFLHFLLQHQHAAAVTRQPDLARHGRRREWEFLDHHLLTWVPDFCAAGRKAARDDFWLGLFDLLQEFVEDEARRVDGAR